MSSQKIGLNLFGEIVNIDSPPNLTELRQKISEKFVLKKADADELILTYTKDSKTLHIHNEDDYKTFLESKIGNIQIDISQNSHIYQENLKKLKEEKEKDEKKLNDLLKQNEEYKKLLSTKFISQKQEIIEITKQIQELFNKRKKLVQYIKIEKAKIIKMKKTNDKAIGDLEKKLGIKKSKLNRTENNLSAYKKRKNRKLKKYHTIKENSLYNQKLHFSQENRKYSPVQTPQESYFQNIKMKNFRKANLNKKTSPVSSHEAWKDKKILNLNENKNTINPFYEENEEAKSQKQKLVKIAEIICNTIKSINDITNDKSQNKLIPHAETQEKKEKKEKKIRLKEKEKEKIEELKSEGNEEINNKNSEKKNEAIKNKGKKNERLISSNKEKNKNLIKKIEEKKIEKRIKRNSKNNGDKKSETNIKNNKRK